MKLHRDKFSFLNIIGLILKGERLYIRPRKVSAVFLRTLI